MEGMEIEKFQKSPLVHTGALWSLVEAALANW